MSRRRTIYQRGFTLIEILMAMAACGVILAAIYGVFSKAIHLRDRATERVRTVRLQARALTVLRNDLRNGLVSGGKLAATLQGSRTAQNSSFPGYLRFTTTTGADTEIATLTTNTARITTGSFANELQEVSYYIVTDPAAEMVGKAGQLVRTVERNLLATLPETPPEEPLLSGVSAMEVEFYDGQSWKDSWEVTTEDQTLPQAVRVRLLLASEEGEIAPAPLEVFVPWTTQPATAIATSTAATGKSQRLASPPAGGTGQ